MPKETCLSRKIKFDETFDTIDQLIRLPKVIIQDELMFVGVDACFAHTKSIRSSSPTCYEEFDFEKNCRLDV